MFQLLVRASRAQEALSVVATTPGNWWPKTRFWPPVPRSSGNGGGYIDGHALTRTAYPTYNFVRALSRPNTLRPGPATERLHYEPLAKSHRHCHCVRRRGRLSHHHVLRQRLGAANAVGLEPRVER